jgi:hypothetical protein
MQAHQTVVINRAPVLTLWAAVVAERLGFDRDEALTLGRAVAGLNAYSKGVKLGLYEPTPKSERDRRKKAREGEMLHVNILHRAVPVVHTAEGVRALADGRPISPSSIDRYLKTKFGDALKDVRLAMSELAHSLPPRELALSAYRLYEQFRPDIPAGVGGWSVRGKLSLHRIAALAAQV